MSPTTEHASQTSPLRAVARAVIPIIVLLAGIGVAVALVRSGPEAKREVPVRQARLVEVQQVEFGTADTRIHAMGTVVPAQEVTLQPLVGGEIVVRSMMYVALSYDHRIVDGREAVTFLVRIKELIEDPHRLLIDV